MENKKALVITFHLKKSVRIGGFHRFIRFLEEEKYDIDWYTTNVSYSWLFKRTDRENLQNFIFLKKGNYIKKNNIVVRNFTIPMYFPAIIEKKINKYRFHHYWPDWKKIEKKLSCNYDVILVEGTGAQWADDLRAKYPGASIIYRPSDVLKTTGYGVFIENPDLIEKNMIDVSDITLCVDELDAEYYRSIDCDMKKIAILRNPLISELQIYDFDNWHPPSNVSKMVVYIGVTSLNMEYIEFAAKKLKDIKFVIIGPFSKASHDNVIYTGVLDEKGYTEYLKNASVGIDPLLHEKMGETVAGYTGKTILYMRYLLPIVTVKHNNYRNLKGFSVTSSKEEFTLKICEALKYSNDDREKLREGYRKLFYSFSEETIKKEFLHYIKIINHTNGRKE